MKRITQALLFTTTSLLKNPSVYAATESCSCELQAFQTTTGDLCSDLSRKGYNTGPIDSVMYSMDRKIVPMMEKEAQAAGIEKEMTNDAMDGAVRDWNLVEASEELRKLYDENRELFEIREVKNLWNAYFGMLEGVHYEVDRSVRKGIDYMNPEFNAIFESMGWSGDRIFNTAEAHHIEEAMINLYNAFRKLFVDYLNGQGVQSFALRIFKHVKPVGKAIDDLANSDEFLTWGMKKLSENGRTDLQARLLQSRSGISLAEKVAKWSELLPQQIELFANDDHRSDDELWGHLFQLDLSKFEGVGEEIADATTDITPHLEKIGEKMDAEVEFPSQNEIVYFTEIMEAFDSYISSREYLKFVEAMLLLPKTFFKVVGEEDFVVAARLGMRQIAQEGPGAIYGGFMEEENYGHDEYYGHDGYNGHDDYYGHDDWEDDQWGRVLRMGVEAVRIDDDESGSGAGAVDFHSFSWTKMVEEYSSQQIEGRSSCECTGYSNKHVESVQRRKQIGGVVALIAIIAIIAMASGGKDKKAGGQQASQQPAQQVVTQQQVVMPPAAPMMPPAAPYQMPMQQPVYGQPPMQPMQPMYQQPMQQPMGGINLNISNNNTNTN